MTQKQTLTDQIKDHLWSLSDAPYADFQSKLIPGTERASYIGVRTPQLRAYAKALAKDKDVDIESFIANLPHQYFDENQLHAFIISETKDFDKCVREVEDFLPYVDNWATCDQLSPKVFAKKAELLLPYIDRWIESDRVYTVRFAIGMLMQHFLDERFDSKYLERIANVRSEEYYINMMIAWYFATALAKQYEPALEIIKDHRLDKWTHNKAIQKAIESRRITPEQKDYLRTLRRK